MDYREYRVSPPLDSMIECVWFLRSAKAAGCGPYADADAAAAAAADAPQRVMPDGCIELIVHLGDAFAAVSADTGASTRQSTSMMVGMLTRPILLQPPAAVDTIGVRFRPGGAYPFVVGVPVAELTDRAIDLDDLWGAFGRRLVEQLGHATSDAARVSIISRELTGRLVSSDGRTSARSTSARSAVAVESDRVIAFVIERLTHTAGRAAIADLASSVGVTTRHLQRRFADRVGVSPKVLARILRFQNTLRHRTASTPIEWARVAIDCGYADQSHLIREYAVFAGETPASLLAAEGELSSYFTAPHRLATLLGARR
jgi:AraC-like DNA-binding protein